jgi:hypothetical protein
MPKIKVEYVVPDGELCNECEHKEEWSFCYVTQSSTYGCALFDHPIGDGDKKSILCKTAEVS